MILTEEEIALTIAIEPDHLQIEPGKQATAAVLIRNRTEEVGQYWMRCDGPVEGWLEISPGQVSVFPLEEARAQLTLHPPADAPGAKFSFIVRAVSQEHAGLEAKAVVLLDVIRPTEAVQAPSSVTRVVTAPRPLTASQIVVRAVPVEDSKLGPSTHQWRLSLRNAGAVLDTFGFNTRGIPARWVNLDPNEITLKPDEESDTLLTVRPIEGAAAGVYPFILRVYSHLNLYERTELEFQILVPLVAAFKLEIVPREAESQGPRDFQIWLHSDASSNSDLQFDLSGGDQDNACSYTFEPAAILLPARQSRSSGLRVEPLTVLAPNERKTHTFRVTATPRGGIAPPAGDEARLTQTGAKPIALLLRPEKQSADLEAEYTVSAVNPSLVETKLNFSAHDPEAECSYEFQPAQLFLSAQTEGKTRLRVRAPSYYDGESSKTFRFTVAATREGDLLPTISTEAQLVQRPLKAIGLELLPSQQSASEAARYVVNARNPRPTAAKVWLGASDETDALSIDIFPNMLSLPAGGQGSAALTAQPKEPLMPGEQRRVHRFTVFAKLDGSDKRFAASGVMAQVSRRAIPPTSRPVASPPPAVAQPQGAVRPVEPVQVEVNPPLRDGQPNANFQIHIRNPNSNQARVWLSAADEKDSLGFAFNPITLTLAPRAQGWAALAVRPKQRLTAGEKRRTYSFVVTARIEGVDRPATANGALVQTSGSACAGFVKSLVIIAVILFILYLILVIGLVR